MSTHLIAHALRHTHRRDTYRVVLTARVLAASLTSQRQPYASNVAAQRDTDCHTCSHSTGSGSTAVECGFFHRHRQRVEGGRQCSICGWRLRQSHREVHKRHSTATAMSASSTQLSSPAHTVCVFARSACQMVATHKLTSPSHRRLEPRTHSGALTTDILMTSQHSPPSRRDSACSLSRLLTLMTPSTHHTAPSLAC